ncbi:sigma-70 family RNA polymerase sigma factor [Celerinatantimonas sp. YJH-8]|uniref:sigma-70 family RNA polymerase sigma factor n=1 Tax=Celerinatantimonas sp. YJH-8 TaxID=3228714 RepID=UPI0038C08915
MINQVEHAAVPCLMQSWSQNEAKLYHWLCQKSGNPDLSFDVLQDTFLRAMQQQKQFCDIHNQQAWLFRVAHNLLRDEQRKTGRQIIDSSLEFPLADTTDEPPAVDGLTQCLPKALKRLTPSEREIIEQCDLQGMSQPQFAQLHGLSLSATKSRIQRARQALKRILKRQCHIRFDENHQVCCFFASSPSPSNK